MRCGLVGILIRYPNYFRNERKRPEMRKNERYNHKEIQSSWLALIQERKGSSRRRIRPSSMRIGRTNKSNRQFSGTHSFIGGWSTLSRADIILGGLVGQPTSFSGDDTYLRSYL